MAHCPTDMTPSPSAKSVGSPLSHVQEQAARLAPQGDRSPVVGRLYHSRMRYSFVIRYQVTPEACNFEHGARFEPVAPSAV